ncbi:MAG: LuxR C-terminal-related transcriptional regulator [Bacteroidales bacterium]|nr:LuxR C-terminal-related transcriptional regulator [Bacteroidales bacterium]
MFKLIAIVDKSHIIREGIASLLRERDICQRIASLENMNDWKMAFKDSAPDLVIINPDLWNKNEVKRHKTGNMITVGMVYQYCDRDAIAHFDDVIYITDTEDVIVNKFRNLQQHHEKGTKDENLTAREKDVLILLLQGLSNKEVAERLVISTHTVIAHRKNIIDKTGIRSLSGLAVYALLNNIAGMDQITH